MSDKSTRLSDLNPEAQVRVLRALCERLQDKVRRMQIELSPTDYGVSLMTNDDRLNNRLMADLVLTENGIPTHDRQALEWLNVTSRETEQQ